MDDPEVVPWEHLKGYETTSIMKLARMLGSVTSQGKPAFGLAGTGIQQELTSYCDWADSQKSPKRKKKKDSVDSKGKEADPRYRDAVAIITAFTSACEDAVGCKPPNMNWGLAIKDCYKLMADGWEPSAVITLAPVFFESRHEQKFIFKDGKFRQFLDGLLRLSDIQGGGAPAKDHYPST